MLQDSREDPGTHVNKPDGQRDKTAEDINFAESGHSMFRAAQCIGNLRIEKQRERNLKSIHSLQRWR